MSPDPRPPVSDQTPTPVCPRCRSPRWVNRPDGVNECGGCGMTWVRTMPAAPPAPTPEPQPADDERPLKVTYDRSNMVGHPEDLAVDRALRQAATPTPPTPPPVSPEDGDEPATWADLLTCERCGRPLEQPGALMFSPPNKAGMVRKHHICADCYLAGEGFTAASGAVS